MRWTDYTCKMRSGVANLPRQQHLRKCVFRGQHCGVAVKAAACAWQHHIGMLVQVPAQPLLTQLPVVNVPWRAARRGLRPWAPACTWKSWKKLHTPGFALAQLQDPLQPFGEWTSRWKICFSFSPFQVGLSNKTNPFKNQSLWILVTYKMLIF